MTHSFLPRSAQIKLSFPGSEGHNEGQLCHFPVTFMDRKIFEGNIFKPSTESKSYSVLEGQAECWEPWDGGDLFVLLIEP